MTALGYGILAAAIVLCAAAVWCERRKTRRTLEKLNEMLTDAMRGDFTEDSFDETLLSALESKLAHYLAASTVSARNVSMEKEKLKTLIGDISHQTKTPIANILLYAQLLREQPGNTVCLDALDAQTKKLQSLIDALVKNISITFLPTDAEAVFDAKWTEEAVFNLLDNAVKYTPAGGAVRVSASAYQMFSAIHVADNGPGIPEDEQPKVFQRFYRGLSNPTEEGVGIGLYLVRQIAEGQGGYVKVSSRPGEGSTFSLYLPREICQHC